MRVLSRSPNCEGDRVVEFDLAGSARRGEGNPGKPPRQGTGTCSTFHGRHAPCRCRRWDKGWPDRQVGTKQFQGDSSHLPLKINTAGVIPPIFASSLLLLPLTVAQFSAQGGKGPEWLLTVTTALQHGAPLYMAMYAAGIIFFSFFYTAVVFNPEETAENLKKYGGFIPGIRPGTRTAEYLDFVLTRITVIGAAYLTVICLLPEFLSARLGTGLALGGTSLLIVVNVTMDTVAQIQSHLLAHQYEGLIRKSKLRGGSRR